MHEDEIAWLGVEALQHEIESGHLTASEVIDASLARIERLDPTLQAYSQIHSDRARRVAAQLDDRRASGEPIGLLHGVPIALKDLCDVAGEPTRAGTTALGDVPPAENAEVVDRLEAAGAIVLGKVKMTEGAFSSHHSSVTPPRNPWNADRWTGISSSGSGVSVAAGLCAAALGTDTGGSIRYPSSACGVTGLKPTHGRVSLRGIFPLAGSLDHIGPMARSVEDVARLFSVLCGHDPRDAWSLSSNPAVATASALIPRARGMRIGIDHHFCEDGVDSPVISAIEAALAVYRELGAEIVDLELPDVNDAIRAWIPITAVEAATAHGATYPSKADEYGADLRNLIDFGLGVDAATIEQGWRSRIAFSRRLEACFDRIDALVSPVIPSLFAANVNIADTTANPAFAIAIRFTAPFNLSGSPCLTLPCGFDRDAAPIGFQIVGAHLDEPRLLALGAAFQAATDWHTRRPPL